MLLVIAVAYGYALASPWVGSAEDAGFGDTSGSNMGYVAPPSFVNSNVIVNNMPFTELTH
jgi:hypothetical protein